LSADLHDLPGTIAATVHLLAQVVHEHAVACSLRLHGSEGAEQSYWLQARERIFAPRRKEGWMASVEKSIDVNVPVRVAYNQWTQFEDFPQFMDGIEEVRQINDTQLHWRASIAGKTEEWDAEIIEQTPDQQVARRSTSGTENSGTVRFTPMGAEQTRVTVVMGYEPEGIVEKVGDRIGMVDQRVAGDLERFKSFIEGRGSETGAWRGEVHEGSSQSNASGS
jgi:uncharacterized membrane protein